MPASQEITADTPVKEYSITRLSKDNLADIARLHQAVYGKAQPAGYFEKKYDTAYTGVSHVGFIAYSNEVPIAYYGVIPCFIQHGNKKMLAAQSADTMTHPGYRFKGMFVELSNITFDLCRQLGIQLIFGFPNQNSYHGAVNKLGWQHAGSMECFTITVKGLPWEKIFNRFNALNNLYKRYGLLIVKKKLLPLAGVANTALQDGFAGVCRDENYLLYKTYSNTSVIEIAGAKIWISNKHGIMIGDMEGVSAVNFNVVMQQLKKIAKRSGIRLIQFHCSTGTALHALFSRHYAATPSYPVLVQDFGSVIEPAALKFSFADIDIF
ncbi:GNAT family N-acetyltransferase [Ferruginibacter sp.]